MIGLVSVGLLLTGCGQLSYYSQSVRGQLELMGKQRPITEVAGDDTTSVEMRDKLLEVLRIRQFAVDELKLPDNDSYRIYADLQRPYAVWNIFAAPEFSLEPKQWCFLIVGCLSYRGYFDERDARRFAAGLRREGLDVMVGGIRAYSTLGWFDDPILNTFMDLPRYRLAGLVFHELAHQQLYIDDDSTFNESFATAVQLAGVRRYLQRFGDEQERRAHELAMARQVEFLSLVSATRAKLQQLYQYPMPPEKMRIAKQAQIEELRLGYDRLRDSWGGYAGYDAWFARDLNNAKLAAVATYQRYVPAFELLLQQQQGRFDLFYREAKALGSFPLDARRKHLDALAAEATSGRRSVATHRGARSGSARPSTAARPNRLP